jgi:hypothetical protein
MDKSQLLFNLQNNNYDVLLPPFQTIANSLTAKQTYSIPIPTDQCYAFISLNLQDGGSGQTFTVAMLQEIRVKVNGVLTQQISGTNLNLLNMYYRSPNANAMVGGNLLILPFVREFMAGSFGALQTASGKGSTVQTLIDPGIPQAETETALNCGSPDANGNQISQVVLEIDVNNTPATGALSIIPKAKAFPKVAGGPGAILFVNTSTYTASNSTTNILTQNNGLLYGDINHSFIDSLHFIPPHMQVDNMQFWLNSQEVFQRTAAENNFWINFWNRRTTQATMTSVDFCETGYADQFKYVAPTSTACRMQFSYGTTEGLPVIQRSVGYLF